MRDWRSGDQWDRRTLYELGDDYQIHVTCTLCRHQNKLVPRHLIPRQPWWFWWGALSHRLRCSCCDKKQAIVRLVLVSMVNHEPTPRDKP